MRCSATTAAGDFKLGVQMFDEELEPEKYESSGAGVGSE